MVKEIISKLLNKQLNEELYSSYLYLQMAAYFEGEMLSGFAKWMRVQSGEEYGHAIKLYDYILNVDAKVVLQKIDAPGEKWDSALGVFEATYKHEKAITRSIDEIAGTALSEKDYATFNFLQWFIGEQVEEESTALRILDKIKMIGDNKTGLFFIDRELGQRAGK
jgi:ferritin